MKAGLPVLSSGGFLSYFFVCLPQEEDLGKRSNGNGKVTRRSKGSTSRLSNCPDLGEPWLPIFDFPDLLTRAPFTLRKTSWLRRTARRSVLGGWLTTLPRRQCIVYETRVDQRRLRTGSILTAYVPGRDFLVLRSGLHLPLRFGPGQNLVAER